MADERPDTIVPQPGGQEAAVLMRTRPAGDSTPEFLSATILPGRGMNVLQITAYLPGKGEVNLMKLRRRSKARQKRDDRARGADDAHPDGQASLAMGGAFRSALGREILGKPGTGWVRM